MATLFWEWKGEGGDGVARMAVRSVKLADDAAVSTLHLHGITSRVGEGAAHM